MARSSTIRPPRPPSRSTITTAPTSRRSVSPARGLRRPGVARRGSPRRTPLTERRARRRARAPRDPRAACRAVGLSRAPALRGAAASAGSACATPASRTRTSCGSGRRPDAEGSVLLDPNALSADGTTALTSVATSESGELHRLRHQRRGLRLAHLGRAPRFDRRGPAGPDRVEQVRVGRVDPRRRRLLLRSLSASPRPTPRTTRRTGDMELRYHRLGADPADDRLVFVDARSARVGLRAQGRRRRRAAARDRRVARHRSRRIASTSRTSPTASRQPWCRPLLDEADASYLPIAAIDGTLSSHTRSSTPRWVGSSPSIVAAPDRSCARSSREASDALEDVRLVGGSPRLPLPSRRSPSAGHLRARRHARRRRRAARHRHAGELAGRRDDVGAVLHVPDLRLARRRCIGVRMADGEVRRGSTRRRWPWDPDDYVTEQVFVTSDDGTRVPLFLTHRRDVAPTGDVPDLAVRLRRVPDRHRPAVQARVAGLDGARRPDGGRLAARRERVRQGVARRGRLANKQNVFDDFAACARWLAASGWTDASRIGIHGRSNGGLLVGACLTQHPELFGAAVAEVGVMDMLRFHRFTIGWGWTSGLRLGRRPRAVPHAARLLAAAQHPPRRGLSADPDHHRRPRRPRRTGHSFKFAAALQAAQAGDAPVIDPHRHRRRPRCRQAGQQAHRRARRRAGLPGAGARAEVEPAERCCDARSPSIDPRLIEQMPPVTSEFADRASLPKVCQWAPRTCPGALLVLMRR